MMYFNLKASAARGTVRGECAKCKQPVYEHLDVLDDAYNVYAGKCPHCKAVNLLGLVGLRGYSSTAMSLVLPTDEEKKMNDMPADCPTSGPAGTTKVIHGSNSGELLHQLCRKDAEEAWKE